MSRNLFFKNNKRQSKLKSRSQTSDVHPFFLPQNALSQRIRYPSIRLSIKKNLSNAIFNKLLELQSLPQSPQHEFFKTNLMPLESDRLTALETPVSHLTASRVWHRQRPWELSIPPHCPASNRQGRHCQGQTGSVVCAYLCSVAIFQAGLSG